MPVFAEYAGIYAEAQYDANSASADRYTLEVTVDYAGIMSLQYDYAGIMSP